MNQTMKKLESEICQFVGEILLDSEHISLTDLESAILEQKETDELLGQIFVRRGLMTQGDLLNILENQLNQRLEKYKDSHRHIGEILLEGKCISRWQLSRALNEQGSHRKKVGQVLIELGYTTRGKVEEALSEQVFGAHDFSSFKGRPTLGHLLLKSHRLTPKQLEAALLEQKRTHEYLGDLLIRKSWITEEELEDLLAVQLLKENSQSIAKRLGEILVETHQISPSQLEQAIAHQGQSAQRKIGDILVEKGLLPLKELWRALRIQKRLATLAMTTVLGSSLLVSCATPNVPIQDPSLTNPGVFASQQVGTQQVKRVPRALVGPHKSITLKNGKAMNIYQNGSKVLENVPFFRQGNDNTCGQAVMSAMVNYWGINMQYQSVVNEANPSNLPTTDDALTDYFRKKGLNAQEYSGATVQNLISQVNQGKPTIILLDFGGLSQEHYVIVVGYNQKAGTFILHDSLEGPYIEMDMRNLDRMWQNKSIRMVHVFGQANYYKLMLDVHR